MTTRPNRLTPEEVVSNPLVTIGIPTFNRAGWLKDCVATALMQTYQRFEIVVSDNASTDETAEMLKEFDDRRLRVVRQETNLGSIPNWNACLAEAKGDYIVFVADDDRIAPWLLERCVGLIRRQEQLPIVVALNDIYLAAENRILPSHPSRKLETGIRNGIDILHEFLRGKISCVMCTIVFRTEILRASGGLPTDWPNAADLACWMPLLLKSSGGLVNECCGTYCIHDETLSSKFIVRTRLEELQRLVDLLRDTAGESIENVEKRSELELQIKRYFACHATALLASHRRKDGTLAETLPLIWQWRRELAHVEFRNVFSLAHPIAIILLPRPITRWLHRSIQMMRKMISPSREPPDAYLHVR
jgi:glycosyltransferase involved in cell wall biosynthesis